MRIDGVLNHSRSSVKSLANRFDFSRLKLLAKLDISETRLPPRWSFSIQNDILRYFRFPPFYLAHAFGRKAVLRLQQNKPVQLSLLELGMTQHQQSQFQHALSQPQGLILVTGPTGSGKSISLYTRTSMAQHTR